MKATAPDALFRRIVEEMPEAVISADREGAIRLWNRGAETVFGYAAEEALGQSLDLITRSAFAPDTGKATARSWTRE